MGSAYRDLVAYRLAVALADDVERQVRQWESFQRWSVGLQLVRALDSVGANIAESSGRWTKPDKRRLLLIARGSLYEAEHWLARAEARGLIPEDARAPQVAELARTLNGLVKQAAGP
jgi:four helix bundle protein